MAVILPALPHVFPGSVGADFALSPDGTAVVNVKPLKTRPVEHAGATYQPWVQQLRVTIDASEVVVDTLTTVGIGLGATAYVKNTAYQRLKLAVAPNGTQTLTWEEARPSVSDHWTKMDEGISIAIELIAIIVMAVLTVLTDGAALVVALIIVALVTGLMEATPKLIADVVGKKVSDASPAVSLLALNATDPIKWNGARAFTLDWAGLNGVLQLGGTPEFVF
jgi:Clostridium P-47 protein